MLRRAPLKRGSGFKRPHREKVPPPAYARVERAGVYGGSTASAVPKTTAQRNPRLLRLARDQACQLQVDGVCCGDRSTTVSCHSNLAEHGKAGARKADDQYVVFGCITCHAWLDQPSGIHMPSYDEKRAAFLAALQRQELVWRRIEGDPARPAADRLAAAWALELLSRG